MDNKKCRTERKKGITDKIFILAAQNSTNTFLPTQEGKVIPISDRHLRCATVSHTHFTLTCHIHKPTAGKILRYLFQHVMIRNIKPQTH